MPALWMIGVLITRLFTRRWDDPRLPFGTNEDVRAVRLLDHLGAVGQSSDFRYPPRRMAGLVAAGRRPHRIERWRTLAIAISISISVWIPVRVPRRVPVRIMSGIANIWRLRCPNGFVLWLRLSFLSRAALSR